MAPELSSNWKKLQAKIKAESPASTNTTTNAAKRKATDSIGADKKRQKSKKQSRPEGKVGKPSTVAGKSSRPQKAKVFSSSKVSPPASAKSMGVPQSSCVTKGTRQTVKPSLSLWARENDISPENLAEAYQLGSKNNASLSLSPVSADEDRRRVNEGLAPNSSSIGKYLALDCEMVGVGPEGRESALARASIVDFHGNQVYDAYVRPKERVTDWRTFITGITPKHMAAAREFDVAQGEVAELLRGRVLVGHDLGHDLAALQLDHPSPQIRDTARHSEFRQYGHGPKPKLKVVAREVLGVEIQGGQHSSLEDARAAMLLFRRRKPEFDVEHANKYGRLYDNRKGDDHDDGDGFMDRGGTSKAKSKTKKKKKH